MNRRAFFNFSFLSLCFDLNWHSFFKNRKIKITYRSIPKSKNSHTFNSAGEFFYTFYGEQSYYLHRKYINEEKTLSLRGHLSIDKKEAYSEFIVKDSLTFVNLVKAHARQFPVDPVEHRIISVNLI